MNKSNKVGRKAGNVLGSLYSGIKTTACCGGNVAVGFGSSIKEGPIGQDVGRGLKGTKSLGLQIKGWFSKLGEETQD